ncbi:MAG: hypothetical protein H6620_12695, partial [Halobacteriovoraceae bacterium]|nr:hypothetical protein [Halobacteriovoraceae bacterium]
MKEQVENWIEILANAALFVPKWAESEFRAAFEKEFEEARNQRRIELFAKSYFDINSRNIYEIEFFKNLFSKEPLKAFTLACEVFERLTFGKEVIKHYEEKGEICLIEGSGTIPKMTDQLPSKDENYTLKELIRHWLVKISTEEPHLFQIACQIVYGIRNKTLLLGIVMALNETPAQYQNEIIELFRYLNNYGELFQNTKLTFHASKLVATAFSSFSPDQRNEFGAIVFGMDEIPKRVIRDDSKKVKNHFLKYNGLYKFNILKHFTKEDLDGYGPLIKLRNELYRKSEFFMGTELDLEWKKIKSPIPKEKIFSFSLTRFIKTVLSFNTNNVSYDSYSGGKEEYSREFGLAVKERPEHFVPYLQELIKIQNSIPVDYIDNGLSGLMEAKYSPEEFEKFLFFTIDKLEKEERWFSVLRFIGYLIDNDILPNRLFVSLEKAVKHSDPEKQKFQSGQRFSQGSIRGEVARIIPYTWKFQAFEKRIWKIVNHLALDPILDVRISLINKLGILTHLDRRKTYEVFIKMIQDGDPDLLDFGANLFAHFTHHYWEEIRSEIKGFEQIEKFQSKLGQIIFFAFMNEYKGAEKLLKAGIARSDEFLGGALVAALNSLSTQDPVATKKCIQVLENNIRPGKKIYDIIESQILNVSEVFIDRLIPFFEKYISNLPPDVQISYSLDYLEKAIDFSPRGVLGVLGGIV